MLDSPGMASLSGSGCIIRRRTLEEIDRFLCSGVRKDVLLPMHLCADEWKTAFFSEALQFPIF